MNKFNIDEILSKADLLAYVERAGGKLHGGSNRYSCACVLHGGDNPTGMSVYFKDGKWLWNCFTGCNTGGDAISFVMKWLNYSFPQACEFIGGEKIEDAQAMNESAAKRLRDAEIETIAAKQREDARRVELRVSEKHLVYNSNLNVYKWMREAWRKAGIDNGMQDFWSLGGCEDFAYKYDEVLHHTPSITIPVFNEQKELMTIQHRLLNPVNPKDKYRPERTGLHSHPFLAMPEMGYAGGIIWVMEGAKKAMVTWTKSGDADWQCIGVPSQGEYKNLAAALKPNGKNVIVVPDPNSESNINAYKLGRDLAREVGGKILRLNEKIDDFIMANEINFNDLFSMSKQARRV
jgi:hypothetical protein